MPIFPGPLSLDAEEDKLLPMLLVLEVPYRCEPA